MKFEITEASSIQDLQQMLALQAKNHREHFSEEEKLQNGFLSVKHNLELLEAMNQAAPQIVAKADGHVVGFAMVMLDSFKDKVPGMESLFESLKTLSWKGKKITDYRYYVMGQVCVDNAFRSMGIFDKLYEKHREIYAPRFDLCVTEIASGNIRSMKAHRRVGFEVVHKFRDEVDEWNVVVWDWR
jgi:ribosomal protein S18 acetylase RimI-like enzyme